MKKNVLIVIVLFFFFIGVAISEASVDIVRKEIEKLKPVPEKLNSILDNMEKTKLVSYKNADEYNKTLGNYAKHLRKISLKIPKLTEVWVKSEGKQNQGMDRIIHDFEGMASEHEVKFKELEKKANRIDSKIKSGEIKLAPEFLKRMSKEEREEFYKHLDKPAREEYKKNYPDLFSKVINYMSELIATPAEAWNVKPCVPLCAAPNPPCIACVLILGGGAAAEQWITFQKAWDACGKYFSSGWRYACRTAAVAVYVAWIA